MGEDEDREVTYSEHPSRVPGVTVWTRHRRPSQPWAGRVLPDGCMDLIWDGTRLLVAGPDTRARWHTTAPEVGYVGLRFSMGLGPAVLGAPADEVRDVTVELDALWPAGDARVLAEQVAGGPEVALERWAVGRVGGLDPPPLGSVVFCLARVGSPVAAMADHLGLSVRQVHRRCLPLFGYGPRHLSRVLRMGRALDAARRGLPLAEVAVAAGFADQAHLSRDVRDLTGTSPTRLLAESRE